MCVTERARSLLDEARAVYDRLGDQRFSARAAVQAGFAWMADGDNARAASMITTSLRSSLELEDVWGTTEGLEAMAAVRAAQGSPERAARTGGAAEVLRETMTVRPFASDRIWTERYMEEARASLDARTWQAAWDAGRALSLEEAVEDALASRT